MLVKLPVAVAGALLVSVFGLRVQAQERWILNHGSQGYVPSLAAHLTPIRRLDPTNRLRLEIGLPLHHQQQLDSTLKDLWDPASPKYRHWLTPEQFTESFGPTEQEYQSVIRQMEAHGLRVEAKYSNRALLSATGTVRNIEKSFGITLRVYRHPAENRTFYAPDALPSLDADVPVLGISGLDNFEPPHPVSFIKKGRSLTNYTATGSGPGGLFMGKDFRAAYAPGVSLDGAGQFVALLDGQYFASDPILYAHDAGLAVPNITNVYVGGAPPGNPPPGTDDGEQSLDIAMIMSMSPSATIMVYEGDADACFVQMAIDNKARQISCSLGWGPPSPMLGQEFEEFDAQGQSFFAASGDGGSGGNASNSSGGGPGAANEYITLVGGTSLTTSSASGPWASETAWVGSGGAVCTNIPIPIWQQGINMASNQGSGVYRNFPDVAMQADTDIFFIDDGSAGAVGGTSAAAPLWAGFMALVNQQAAALGNPPVGFLNPPIYAIGQQTNYTSVLHDIRTGNTYNSIFPTMFSAVAGYDLCTGWGSPNGQALINALAGTNTAPNFSLDVLPAGLVTLAQGSNATATIVITSGNGFDSSVGLSVSGLPGGVTASFSPASATTNSTLTLTANSTASVTGAGVVTIVGTGGGLIRAATLGLIVVTPLLNTNQPAFTLSASPASVAVPLGGSSASTIVVNPWNGFSNSVNLSIAGLPGGMTAAFSPFSVTNASTLTISARDSAIPGTNTLTITGISDRLNETTPITLIINTNQPTAPGITLTSPANNTAFAAPATVILAAAVASNGNVIDSVQFYANSTLIGQVATAPYSCVWSNLGNGSYNVFAQVVYNGENTADSLAACIAVTNASANLGFESPSLGVGNFEYAPSNASWTFNGSAAAISGSGIVANGSPLNNPSAPQGVQAAFLREQGVISQALGGFTPGGNYTLSYSAAQRPGDTESWNVLVDNAVVQTNNGAESTNYTTYSVNFTALAPVVNLSFAGTDLEGRDNTVFLDNITITVNPNFGFEIPSVGAGGYEYDPFGGSWTFSGASPNGSGIVANGSGFNNPNAPQGNQAAFVQAYGTITQAISGLNPGTNYILTFQAAERPGYSESWKVTVNGATVGSYNPGPGATAYIAYTASLIATAATETLAFVGTDLAGNEDAVFIDDVQIAPVLPGVPAAPAGLAANAGNTQVTLNWQASVGATSYNVKSATVVGGPYSVAANVTGTNFLNTDLANGTTYYYVVSALNANGESVNSRQVSATPQAPPPTGLTALAGNGQVSLSWNASSEATSYIVERSTTSGGPYSMAANVTGLNYLDAGLVNGATYYYVVWAMNAAGPTGNSSQVSASPPGAALTTVANFGFEAPSLGFGHYEYDPSAASWTFSGASPNGSGIVANGSDFDSAYAPQGAQAAFVQTYGAMTQAISGFNPGTNYILTFLAAERPGYSESWKVTVNGATIGNYNPGPGATAFMPYAKIFTATAGTETLAFVGTDLAGNEDAVFIDDVQIAPVPATPMGLTATAGDLQVSLAWNTANGATSYNVESSTTNGGPYATVTNVTTTNCVISGLIDGTTYYFVVSALNSSSSSPISSQAAATPQSPPPLIGAITPGLGGHGLSLSASGLPSRLYYLDMTINLTRPVLWTRIQTNMSDSAGHILFTNLAATNQQQFFNVSAP